MEAGRRLDLALGAARTELGSTERAWLQVLTYGVLRLRGRLDCLLDHHLHQGLDSVRPRELLQVLRLGAYQILFMGGVPDYAAVDGAVELAKEVAGEGSSSLVNAVLRSVARTGLKARLFPHPEEDPRGHLVTWGSHPRWLVDRWLERWSEGDVARLVRANNRVPPVYLSAPASDSAAVVEILQAAGLEGEPVGWDTGCIRLARGTRPSEALRVVPRSLIQDPAAALVARYVDPTPGTRVADLCAAPGGKCLALAMRGAYVLAADRSAARLRLVDENARRAELKGGKGAATRARIALVQALAEAPPLKSARVVLLDVPCSGTGTLRRHPDARWRLSEEEIAKLAGVQRRILEGAADVVEPGGLLVYATCTLEAEENELQVNDFLERHPEFEIDAGGGVTTEYLDDEGFLRVLPQRTGFDGAFGARLRRRR